MYYRSVISLPLTLGCWCVGGHHACNTVFNWWLLTGGVLSWTLREHPGFLLMSLCLSLLHQGICVIHVLLLGSGELCQLPFTPPTEAAVSLSLCLLCRFLAEQHGDGETMRVLGPATSTSRFPSCQSAIQLKRRSIAQQPHRWWFHSFGILSVSQK